MMMIFDNYIKALYNKLQNDNILVPQVVNDQYFQVWTKDGVIGRLNCHYEITWEPRIIAKQDAGNVYVCFHCENRTITKQLERIITSQVHNLQRFGWKKCFSLRYPGNGWNPKDYSVEEFVDKVSDELYSLHKLLGSTVASALAEIKPELFQGNPIGSGEIGSIFNDAKNITAIDEPIKMPTNNEVGNTHNNISDDLVNASQHDIFISYSRKDKTKVDEICKELRKHGYSVWIDTDGIFSGDEFKTKLVKAIRESSVFVFISSFNSNSSEWTVKEVNTAVRLKKKILPVILDDSEYADSVMFDLSALDFTDIRKPDGIKRILISIGNMLGK